MADPFVATTIDTPNPYCLVDYVQNSIYRDYEVFALLDRSLVSRAVALASGRVVDHGRPDSDTYRLAAACISFLITAQVNIEPDVAFCEFASHDPETARGRIKSWRVAEFHARYQRLDAITAEIQERIFADEPGYVAGSARRHGCALFSTQARDRHTARAAGRARVAHSAPSDRLVVASRRTRRS